MTKLTIRQLRESKGKRKLTISCAFDRWTVKACANAGIDMLLTWGNETGALEETLINVRMARSAAPDILLASAIPKQLGYVGEEEAARCALLLQANGADVIYSSGMAIESFAGLARRGIPCVGHVGYLPVRDIWLGGPRAVGKTATEAREVYNEVMAMENAGLIGVEMELLPVPLAKYITERSTLLTFSMGSGPDCDGQFLFSCDLLGQHDGHYPRHAKTYLNTLEASTGAMRRFKEDVLSGAYPGGEHSISMSEEEFSLFLSEREASTSE